MKRDLLYTKELSYYGATSKRESRSNINEQARNVTKCRLLKVSCHSCYA